MKLKNIQLSDQEIKINNDQVNFLGSELVLKDCDIVSNCDARTLIFSGVSMIGGKFIQEDVLHNFEFTRVHFLDVKFFGSYNGCDFGDWDSTEKSSIEGGDFSSTNLDGCRFLNCNPETLIFPKWPCFAMIHPSDVLAYVSAFQWPGDLGSTMESYADNDPECVAVCGNAERISKKYGISLEKFRELLILVPGIRILD